MAVWYVSNVPASVTRSYLENLFGGDNTFVYMHRMHQRETNLCSFTTNADLRVLTQAMAMLAPLAHIGPHHTSGLPDSGIDWHQRWPPLPKGIPARPKPPPSGVLDQLPRPMRTSGNPKGSMRPPEPKVPPKGAAAHHPPMAPRGHVVPPRAKGPVPTAKAGLAPAPVPVPTAKAGPAPAPGGKAQRAAKRRKTEGASKGRPPFYGRQGGPRGKGQKGQGNEWNEANPDDYPDPPGSLVERFFPAGARSNLEEQFAGGDALETTPKGGAEDLETKDEQGAEDLETMEAEAGAGGDPLSKAEEGAGDDLDTKAEEGGDTTKSES